MMTKYSLPSIALVAVLFLAGCTPKTYRHVDDSALALNQIAVLEHHDPQGSKFVIQHIDGQYRGFGLFNRYELKPGVREISYWWRTIIPGPSSSNNIIHLLAEAGETYVIEAVDVPGKENTVIMSIRNKRTGKAVSGYGVQ